MDATTSEAQDRSLNQERLQNSMMRWDCVIRDNGARRNWIECGGNAGVHD
jgi:hypothetical protein